MKLNEIVYSYKFNKGNYEAEEIQVSLTPENSETALDLLAAAKSIVHGTTAPAVKEPEQLSFEDKKEEAPKEKPVKTKKVKAEPVKEEVVEVEEEVVEEKKAPAEKSKKSAKGVTNYNRTDELHRKLIGEELDRLFPTWRTDPSVSKKVKAASANLDGEEFIDAESSVLETFVEKLKKLVS